jgi:hypothetical protein
MSDYEEVRKANIARNEARLQALGIGAGRRIGPKADPVAPKAKATAKRSRPEPRPFIEGERRSTRATKPVVSYKAGDDGDDDDDYTDDGSISADDFDGEEIPLPKRIAKAPKARTGSGSSTSSSSSSTSSSSSGSASHSFLTLELAKTGRSTCRGACRETIPQGAPRVGMVAWIVGRQAITWQRPGCLISGLSVEVEQSGRCKCKHSGEYLTAGAYKLGVHSHTAVSWVSFASAPAVLAPVLAQLGSTEEALKAIQSCDALSAKEFDEVREEVLAKTRLLLSGETIKEASTPVKEEAAPVKEDSEASSKKASIASERRQPENGKKTNTSGKVCWKFGGSLCYGILMPKQETSEHCYAKTHKGNTKTLAKGKDYWWMLSDEGSHGDI